MEIVPSTTARGFALLEFSDLYGARCNVQLSSPAEPDTIWLSIEDAEPKIMASQAAAFGVDTREPWAGCHTPFQTR